MTAGYSSTPLPKKLGIKPGFSIRLINAPSYYLSLLEPLPDNLHIADKNDTPVDFIHFFALSPADLEQLLLLKTEIKFDGSIWVSWEKKKSKLPDALNENIIRNKALEFGLVDVKVCAVDDEWSGLKLVYRLKDRK